PRPFVYSLAFLYLLSVGICVHLWLVCTRGRICSGTYNDPMPLLRQLRRELTSSWLNVLLVAAPVSWVLDRGGPSFSVFVTSAIALIPAAGLIGAGTEALARRSGPTLGGFLNATFGNAAELIIAIVALQGHHLEVVKASITGSIIGNLLLVFGLSCLAG